MSQQVFCWVHSVIITDRDDGQTYKTMIQIVMNQNNLLSASRVHRSEAFSLLASLDEVTDTIPYS